MKFFIIFILIFLSLCPISSCESIMIKNDLCINQIDNILVFEDNNFIGMYNYTDNIPFNDSSEYIFVLNHEIIDTINSETFLVSLFSNYGYIIISILGLMIIIGIGVYFFNKVLR